MKKKRDRWRKRKRGLPWFTLRCVNEETKNMRNPIYTILTINQITRSTSIPGVSDYMYKSISMCFRFIGFKFS